MTLYRDKNHALSAMDAAISGEISLQSASLIGSGIAGGRKYDQWIQPRIGYYPAFWCAVWQSWLHDATGTTDAFGGPTASTVDLWNRGIATSRLVPHNEIQRHDKVLFKFTGQSGARSSAVVNHVADALSDWNGSSVLCANGNWPLYSGQPYSQWGIATRTMTAVGPGYRIMGAYRPDWSAVIGSTPTPKPPTPTPAPPVHSGDDMPSKDMTTSYSKAQEIPGDNEYHLLRIGGDDNGDSPFSLAEGRCDVTGKVSAYVTAPSGALVHLRIGVYDKKSGQWVPVRRLPPDPFQLTGESRTCGHPFTVSNMSAGRRARVEIKSNQPITVTDATAIRLIWDKD